MLSKQELFVFPTSRAIRSFISEYKKENKLLPFVYTIDEFLKKSIIVNNKKYCDEEQRILYLNQAIKDIDISKLGISKNFAKFLKQSEYIYRFFIELSSEKIDINDIKAYDTYEYYYEHLEILKQIQRNYLNILDKNNYVDKINLSSYYKINKNFLKKFSKIEILFEGYFTKVEYDIIKKISKEIDLNIKFYSNEYNQKSLEIFNFIYKDIELNYKYNIDLTNESLIDKRKITPRLKNLEIKGFSSRINQIAYIKSTISKCIESGTSPSDIVLILPDENFTSFIDLFDNEKYFNYAMGRNINKYNLYQVAIALYNHMSENELKNIKVIDYFNIDTKFIENEIKYFWNKTCSKEKFNEICNFIKNYETNNELLEKFEEIIYKLNNLFFSTNQVILLKDLYKIFLQKISKIKLDDINSGKITVMGLLETRASSFDTIIICDFNESFIPKKSVKDKFLSTKIKEKTNLPTSKDRENLQKYYYKRLVDSCKNIYISYENSDSNQLTRFANELFKDKIDYKVHDNTYKHILYYNHSINHFNKEIIEKVDFSKMTWSATSLKVFLTCKRKFYLQYILKIGEHTLSLKPKAFELGNIIHQILEDYYKIDDNKNILTYERIEELFNKHKSNNPFLILDLEIWKKKLKEFHLYDSERITSKSIVSLEKSFNFIYEGIRLKGVIDRIDKEKDFYEVIDYKTSNSLKIDTIKNYEKSTDFQLEFYYLAMVEMYKTDKIRTYYYDLNNIKLLEEILLDKKLELLLSKFDELKELSKNSTNFSKCEEKSNCQFCPYLIICNRD